MNEKYIITLDVCARIRYLQGAKKSSDSNPSLGNVQLKQKITSVKEVWIPGLN